MNFKENYYKYKKMNDKLRRQLNLSKAKIEATKKDIDKYTKKLQKLKNKLMDKGLYFWFTKFGKVIAKNIDKELARNSLIKKIEDDEEDYMNTNVYSVSISFIPEEIMSEEKGALEITILEYTVKTKNYSVYLQSQPKSQIRIYYKYDEIKKFKLSHLKNIIIGISNNKINSSKIYHYKDIKSIVNNGNITSTKTNTNTNTNINTKNK
jgi:hypothetical protein